MIYQYATGRAKRHANALLGGYRGIVQCDDYNAYKRRAEPARSDPPVTLAFCWRHARRGFYDPAKWGTLQIATEALVRIAALYRIETEIRGRDRGERLARRQELSRPLVTDLRHWFEAQLKTYAATLTEGIYLGHRKSDLRDRLADLGAQYVCCLGEAVNLGPGPPHDGCYELSRLVLWVADRGQIPG